MLAWLYLVTFGSVIGYTAYAWLLHHAPLGTVSTYAYVNPVVAVFLGWLILDETITTRMIAAGAIIIIAVAIIISTGGTQRREEPIEDDREPEPAAA